MPNKKGLPTETEIQYGIKQYLEIKGYFCFKNHQSFGSYKGIADLFAIKGNKNLWIEVKTPKGKLSQYQKDFRDDIQKHGGYYFVAKSIDDIIEIVKLIDSGYWGVWINEKFNNEQKH